MKWNFKLNGLHLFSILIIALVLFSFIRPIMEGFSDDYEKRPGFLQSLSTASKDLYNDATSDLSRGYNAVTNDISSGYNAASNDISSGYNDISNGYLNNNTGSYIGPAGDTVLVDNPRQPMQLPPPPPSQPRPQPKPLSQPLGIPKSQIPSGSEDMYILKSQVIPPVCPACPNVTACPRPAPYPPCPPCSRCPEPSFECKKVPNYNSSAENSYLPRPVLADFSQFGM